MKQRIIKFRCWDKLSKSMLENNVEWNLGLLLSNPKDFKIMQFTGMRDRNGTEIFEGDKVKVVDSPSNWTTKGDEVITTWVIVFENGKFLLKNGEEYYNDYEDCHGAGIFLGHGWAGYEVIGNKYENKNLDNMSYLEALRYIGFLSIEKEKEKADIYYRLEEIESGLRGALEKTREEHGFSLRSISNTIKKTLRPEEVKSLIKELNK